MICKKDVILWFKELESYKRIDTMCTLLNMCLPFELRFLGTCLEELGRRDSQELRGMELRVNNPQDLAADIVACQKGEPTDKKIRRKMALYLALIRACNRTCVAEIFRTLEGWGDRDFFSMNDPDTLQELLLVYTMAANHPVFSFEQHMKCTEIFEKIKENKLVSDSSAVQNVEQTMTTHQQDLRHLPQSHTDLLQQHALHAVHLSGQHPQLVTTAPIQVLPQGTISMNFPQAHLAKLIQSDGNLPHHINVEGIPHMISSNISIPSESGNILAHPNATWTLRPYQQPGSAIEHPPQSSSPMLSQQSSPSSSRTTSPNRAPSNMMQQGMQTQPPPVRNVQQRMGGGSLKSVRRPSIETTPPPTTQMMSNDIIMPQSMKHVDDVEGSGNQLQTLIRNGFTRTGHHARLKAGNYIPPPQQQQSSMNHFQTIPVGSFSVNAGLAYSMQNISMTDGGGGGGPTNTMEGGMLAINSHKSTGSDSGSSIGSSGETSPPETPTINPNTATNSGGNMRLSNDSQQPQQQQHKHHHQQQHNYNKQLNLVRHNGRSEKLMVSGRSDVSTGSTLIYAHSPSITGAHQQLTQQQSQQLFGTDIVLAPGGNAGTPNIMQTSMSNNNNSGSSNNIGSINTSTNSVSTNNNVANNTVIISSSSGASGGMLGNVLTSNSVLLQPHQQQYNTSYPYHAAAAAAAQHLASASRPPLMTHNPGMAPPPPGTFRLPGFQIPPNGELIYPTYHPAGIAFLSSGAPQGAPPVSLRSSNSAPMNSNANTGVQAPQMSQQQPPSTLLSASPYSSLTIGVNKPISCYNCGSQTHSGRDCQEASMDDVTRSAIYKLDYSISASSTTSPTVSIGPNTTSGNGTGGGNMSENVQTIHNQKQHHTVDSNVVPPSTPPVSSLSTTAAGAINTK